MLSKGGCTMSGMIRAADGEPLNALSVDVEDWYQAITSLNRRPELWSRYEPRVLENTHRILAILEEFDTRATFFVLGKVAKDFPELVCDIDAAGHEIAVHGYSHKKIHNITRDEFALELERATDILTPLSSGEIIGHRAPYFSINQRNQWALDVLEELGFRYDSSYFPTRNILYGYPDAPRYPHVLEGRDLYEFPLSTVTRGGFTWPVAGGFYLRLFPYSIIRHGIRRIHRQGQPAVMYFHPWEIDVEHRHHRVTLREWIVQYTGRHRFERRLRNLLTEFKFGPIRDLLQAMESPTS
jgi:polysaccharide deacetylase family protein (PEP-CTERM system associated)